MGQRWANPKSVALLKHGNVGHKQHARPAEIINQKYGEIVDK